MIRRDSLSISGLRLQSRQKSVLATFINSNNFHVLITCPRCHPLITLLFTPSELRTMNITLHMRLGETNGTLSNVTAYYIIEETEDTVKRLVDDIQQREYDKVEIAFIGGVQRDVLKSLAGKLKVPTVVRKVVDLHLGFEALEENLFALSDRSDIRLDQVADGLVSVLTTLGIVPIIRAQTGGIAEKVAVLLVEKMRKCLDIFVTGVDNVVSSFRKSLLLLIDRDFDLDVMMHHTWTYQALIHDCLGMKRNRVPMKMQNRDSQKENKNGNNHVLNKKLDDFWERNCASPFPKVAEEVDAELQRYRGKVESINRRAVPGENGTIDTQVTNMENAIASLPELAKRKEIIDIHTNLATKLLDVIKARALDGFFELEDQIMFDRSNSTASYFETAVLDLINGSPFTPDGEKRGIGTPSDRLRLFIIFYLRYGSQLSHTKMLKYAKALQAAGCDLRPVTYVQEMRGFKHEDGKQASMQRPETKRAIIRGLMTSVVNRGYRGIRSVAQNATELVASRSKSLKVANVLSYFMSEDARKSQPEEANLVLDGYKFFYPKMTSADEDATEQQAVKEMKRILFSEAIVFIVGGGNYVEFQNIQDCIANIGAESPKVVYGATSIISAEEFLNQMAAFDASA